MTTNIICRVSFPRLTPECLAIFNLQSNCRLMVVDTYLHREGEDWDIDKHEQAQVYFEVSSVINRYEWKALYSVARTLVRRDENEKKFAIVALGLLRGVTPIQLIWSK